MTPAVQVGKFAASVVDTGGNFATDVVDTSGKFATSIVDAGGAPWFTNISEKVKAISDGGAVTVQSLLYEHRTTNWSRIKYWHKIFIYCGSGPYTYTANESVLEEFRKISIEVSPSESSSNPPGNSKASKSLQCQMSKKNHSFLIFLSFNCILLLLTKSYICSQYLAQKWDHEV